MTGRGLGMADQQRENALLVGIIEAISAGPALDLLAARVAHLIGAATAADACLLYVLDDTDRTLTLAGASPPFHERVGRTRLSLGEGIAGWVASRREPVVIVDLGEPGKPGSPRRTPQEDEGFASMASVPMASGPGGLVGVLEVRTRARRDFTGPDVRLLTSIGSLVAGGIHQARLHRRLAARERAHERFTEQVIAAQEAERRRLAADIHDGITQRVCSLRFHLDAAADALADGSPRFAAEQLVRARELADLAFDETRAAITGLRPPVLDDLGLADGLASLARSIPEIEVLVDAAACPLPEHVEIALYRIAQEALQNVVKHAGVGSAYLRLHHTDDEVTLEVCDDGRGFEVGSRGSGDDQGAGGHGMRSMAERADLIGGRFEVRSHPGWGTTVTARVRLR